jgi:hypothetical protein
VQKRGDRLTFVPEVVASFVRAVNKCRSAATG